MHDTEGGAPPSLLVIGYGAAGRAYTEAFAAAGASVTASDPVATAEQQDQAAAQGVRLTSALPQSLHDFDMVIVLTPAAASRQICGALAALPGVCPVLDLTSSAPDTMRDNAAILTDRFIDGTVLGAVGLSGIATPMIFAGASADKAKAILGALGCRITCLDGAAPGTASELKLLRSVFVKGLEALFVEFKLCAAAMDHDTRLRLMLWDLGEVEIFGFLEEMLRTHPRHAERRLHEVEAAQALVAEKGLATPMTEATRMLFSRTAKTRGGPDTDPQEALSWLRQTLAAA